MTKKENEEILRLAIDRFHNSYDSDKEERKLAEDDTKFAINDENCQWPAAVWKQRTEANPPRPCLVINKIPEKIDQDEGEFRQLRPSIKIRGVDSQSDPKIAEIIAGIIRNIEYNSDARTAYNTAYSSTLYSGRGAWRIDKIDCEEDPFVKELIINRIPNALTVYWDSGAKRKDKSDSNYIFVTEELSEKEFKAQYPNTELMEWDATNETLENWRTDETIRVAEYFWKEKEDKIYYRIKRGNTELTVTELQEGDEKLEEKIVKVPKIRVCKMIATKIIEGPFDWEGKYIPIIIEIGKEVNIKGQSKTRGKVRFAKEQQRVYNYWSTNMTEQIALAPKAPYLATPKMIGAHKTQWDTANVQNYLYLLYDVDTTAPGMRPTREPPPQLSTALAHELSRMDHDIMSAMGRYEASLGDTGEEKSGKAIIARQRQGSIGSYVYIDNFQTALIHSAKILIDLIPKIYDTERIIKIRGEDDTEKTIPINARPDAPILEQFGDVSKELLAESSEGYINDLSLGKYDVAATIGPSYATQREEALEMLLGLVEKIPQFGMAALDLIVKNMDLPGADELIKRVKKLIPPGIRDVEPGEEQLPPSEPEIDPKMMVEMQKTQNEAFKLQIEEFKAMTRGIKDIAEAESKERGQQLAELTAFIGEIKSNLQSQQIKGA